MRKALLTVAAAAAAALASGCGADDVDPAEVANAADATRKAQTAQIDVRMRVEGFGLPRELTVTGGGTTALDSVRMGLDLDLGPVLRLAGAQGDGATALVVRGADVYVDPPRVRGLDLPGGASWLRVDVAELVEAAGIDAAALGEVMTIDPGTQLDVLRAAEGVEEVGTETIQGAETTHLRGEVSLGDYASTLPPERRRRALEAIEQLARGQGGRNVEEPLPFDVWIDGRDRIRRMTQGGRVPAQAGVPGGEFTVAMELGGFGAPVEADAPPRRDVFDATDAVSQAAGPTAR